MPPSQQALSQAAAYLTTLIALSLLAGWLVAFRARTYVGWLGLGFLALAIMFHLRRAEIIARGWPFLIVATVFFVLAFLAAARESAQRLRALRAEREAAEQAFLEIVRAEAAKREPGGASDEARSSEAGG